MSMLLFNGIDSIIIPRTFSRTCKLPTASLIHSHYKRNSSNVGRQQNSTTSRYRYITKHTFPSSASYFFVHQSIRRSALKYVAVNSKIMLPELSFCSISRNICHQHQRNWEYVRCFTTEHSSHSTESSTTLSTGTNDAIDDDNNTTTTIPTSEVMNDDVNLSKEANETNHHELFNKLLYDDEAYDEAYKVVTTARASTDKTDQHEDWKQNGLVQLFDAIIAHHQKLVDTYNRSFPTMMKSSINSATAKQPARSNHTITPEQIQTLRQMIQMAEMANNIIELMEPFLGPRHAFFIDGPLPAIDTNTIHEEMVYDDNHNGDNGELLNNETDVEIMPSDERMTASEATSTLSPPSINKIRKKRNDIDLELTSRCDDVLTAWAQTVYAGYRGNVSRSYIRAIPQRAQFLLSRMEITVEDEDYGGLLIPPSLISYNNVLRTWAYSCEHLRAASAQHIFDKLLSTKYGTAYGQIRPDGESFRYIIWAWSLSRERRAAFIATGHLIKMLRRLEVGFDDNALYEGVAIEPSIEDYNIVAYAWTRSEEKNSPGKAQSILILMERMYKKGVTMLQPDLYCYKSVLLAAAQRPDVPDLGPLVDETLVMMRDRFIVPDTECYTAAIKTWKNGALHQPGVTTANQQSSVRRTLELLAEMDVAHNQSMMVSISVSTENINDVLEALTVSNHRTRTSTVDELLDKLSRNKSDGTTINIVATAESYIYALRVWRTIESKEKIAKGKMILWRVKDNYAELVRQHHDKSANRRKDLIVEIFNEFVHLCGSYQPKSDMDGLQALGEALDAIRVMRSMHTAGPGLYHKLVPNASTFASLLLTVTNLLSQSGPERRIAVENIFSMCCSDGMVDDNVLRCFRDAATSDQFATLVESKSEIIEGMKVVPESWTSKALGGKVKSVDGRKTIPLGIDGLLKRTTGMEAFQMRRLLDHRNRDLLRGGRWLSPSKKNPQTRNSKSWKLYDSSSMVTSQIQ